MLRPACLKISLFLVVLLFLKASQHIAPGSSVWIDIKGHSKGQGWSMCQKLIMLIWVCPDKYIGWKLLIPRYCVLTNKLIWNFLFLFFNICWWVQLFPVRVKTNKRDSSVVATEPGSLMAKWAVSALIAGALSRLNGDAVPGVRVRERGKLLSGKCFPFAQEIMDSYILLLETHPLSFTWRWYSRGRLRELSPPQDHLWRSLDITWVIQHIWELCNANIWFCSNKLSYLVTCFIVTW